MPKELIGIGPGNLEWREYDEKPIKATEIRVRCVHAATKHGTEMSDFKGYGNPRGKYDSDLEIFTGRSEGEPAGEYKIGNMFFGLVEETGSEVSGINTGDRVFAYGPFRESHTVTSDKCFPLMKDVNWKTAMCLDPAVFAMGAVRDGNVRVGDRVVVFGLGAIGLMVVQLAKLSGASEVFAVDPIALRRDIALKLGASQVFDPTKSDVGRDIKVANGNKGVDVAIEYSGVTPALQQAIRSLAFGGTIVCGAYPPPLSAGLDLGAEAHFNRPNLVFSRACSDPSREHPRWDEQRLYRECLQLINSHKLNGEDIVQPVVPFRNLATEYLKIAKSPETLVKLGVDY